MARERVWKVLAEGGKPHHGGTGAWPLPKDGKPGAWVTVTGDLVPCENGLHLCRRQDLIGWLGPVIWEAEYTGQVIDHGDKIVVRRARLVRRVRTWNERTARLFACDCAEAVLHLFERDHPKDRRPRQAIETSRRFAAGTATAAELDAARAAARDAARDALKPTVEILQPSAVLLVKRMCEVGRA